MQIAGQLSNLQLELLKMFNYDLSERQLKDIRKLLADYFAEEATREMDRICDERNWSEVTIQEWSEEHMRLSGQ